MIRITEVRIHLIGREDSDLKAYANITFDDCFVIHGIRVIQGEKGIFIAMPRRRRNDGSSQDIAHPINNETRRLIETRVIEAYQHALKQAQAESGSKQE